MISGMGANAIPIAKIFYVFPASIFFMLLYSKLSNYMDGKKIFVFLVSGFGIMFLTYALFFIDHTNSAVNFTFYTLAELWSTVVFGTGMWAFFNDICTIDEAKRFYVLVSGAQVGSIVASGSVKWLVRTFGNDGFVKVAVLSIVASCFLIVLTVYTFKNTLINKNVEKEVTKKVEKKKSNLANSIFSLKFYKDLFKGLTLIFRSRYLFLIFIITLSYNFTIIVTEFIWYKNLQVVYPAKQDIFVFMGNVSFWTTILASIVTIFLTNGIIRYVGLTIALIMFPMVFGLSSSIYFFMYMTPIGGAVHWSATKISKYALADPAKQMLYIPCPKEERYKAKSVIDIVGARGGKATASLFNYFILANIELLRDKISLSYPLLMFITLLWFISALSAGIIFAKHEKKEEEAKNEA